MNRELRENAKAERRNGQNLRENAEAESQTGQNPRNKPESEKGREPQEQAGMKKRNESIGIHNVNRRLKAVYGEKYGIYLEAVQPKGLMVVLMAKAATAPTTAIPSPPRCVPDSRLSWPSSATAAAMRSPPVRPTILAPTAKRVS